MDKSINVKNEKQACQKPPRNLVRIISEVLIGAITGFAVACPVLYLIGAGTPRGCFAGFVALGYMLFVGPPVYGFGTSVGVYLVGSIGKETGSFLLTLVSGFLGGLFTHVMLRVSFRFMSTESSSILIVGLLDVILPIAVFILVLLIPPATATLGFNLTRRYKQPPSS